MSNFFIMLLSVMKFFRFVNYNNFSKGFDVKNSLKMIEMINSMIEYRKIVFNLKFNLLI